jgi:CheY-like chemotaxis protein/pSer/pThr/pTyr-binding forkhead associated (FHA) protein
MVKHYLVVEEGLLREKLIPIADRLTVGRDEDNDIRLSDPSVSKHHAVVRVVKGRPVVEDLGSRNGTFINNERVRKSLLRPGDRITLGNSTIRFLEEAASAEKRDHAETQDLTVYDVRRDKAVGDDTLPSRRVLAAVSRVPLFSGLAKEQLAWVCRTADLAVFEAGKTIVRQGDRGRALYLILDGKVRVTACDEEGKEVLGSFLKENQMFGEMSFLSGRPCSVTFRAEEETLLCEIRSEIVREILKRSPGLEGILEEYYRDLLKKLQKEKRAAGVREQRKDARFNVELRVDFSVSLASSDTDEFQDKVFQAEASDLSVSGIRLRIRDLNLMQLPVGQKIHMMIFLPELWGMVPSLGIVRNMSQDRENRGVAYLGIEFAEMALDHKIAIERFLLEGEPAAGGRVLVVDDEEQVRELLSEFLRGNGYDVALAESGKAALDVAERWNPHVILLDIRLPDLDGIEVCARLRSNEKTRSIPVIVATAFEDTAVDAFDAGADDFVSKPFQLTEIALRVGAMLRVRHLTNELERATAYLGELENAPQLR